MMTIVIEQVCLLIAFAAVGYLLSKTKIADAGQSKLLSVICFYIFLPCKVFTTFAEQFTPKYLSEYWPLLLGATVIVASLSLIAIPISRLLTKDPYGRNVYHYSLTISNYGYIGYALAEGIFGKSVLMDVMMFAFPVCLYTYTIGYGMLTGGKFNWKKLFNPVTLSMVLGAAVGLSGWQLPGVVTSFLNKSAACMSPVSMLLMGMVISQYKIRALLSTWQNYVIIGMRLVVIPCAVTAVLKLLQLEMLVLPTIMVLAMPTSMNTIVFSKLMGQDSKPGASMAMVSSILCCATIPLCLWIFGIL